MEICTVCPQCLWLWKKLQENVHWISDDMFMTVARMLGKLVIFALQYFKTHVTTHFLEMVKSSDNMQFGGHRGRFVAIVARKTFSNSSHHLMWLAPKIDSCVLFGSLLHTIVRIIVGHITSLNNMTPETASINRTNESTPNTGSAMKYKECKHTWLFESLNYLLSPTRDMSKCFPISSYMGSCWCRQMKLNFKATCLGPLSR